MKIHMIDDDEEMHELLTDYFSVGPFQFSASPTPEEGLQRIAAETFDLILLDLMLPGFDGFEACRRIRAQWPDLPVLMLTARKDDYNKIAGLEIGADDYLAKPFNPRELEARIKAILRRVSRASQPAAEATATPLLGQNGDLVVNSDARSVRHHGQLLDLTTAEFDILYLLMRNRGIVMTRDAIIQRLRGEDFDGFDRTIDVLISRLRQKLGEDPRQPQLIRTVRGVGYVFADPT